MLSRNAALEDILAKAPAEPDGYLVYSDWLSGQGDPRGELIAVQHTLSVMSAAEKAEPRGQECARREKIILEEQRRFMPDVPLEMVHTTWRWGFIEAARFEESRIGANGDFVEIASHFFASPVTLLLRSLTIGVTRWEHIAEDVPAILGAAGASPARKHIREIEIGKMHDIDASMYNPGNLEVIGRRFPALESLVVYGSEFVFGSFDLPRLKTLIVKTCGFTKAHLKALLDAKWPALEHLELWFGSEGYGCDCTAADLAALLEGSAFPKVRHLGLRNAEFTDELPGALAGSKLLARLKTLDLSMGTMASVGVSSLLDAADAFRHLEAIDVDENFLGDDEIDELRAIGPSIRTEDQKEDDLSIPGEIHRYVSMHE